MSANSTNFSVISFSYLQENHFQKLISLSLSSFLTIFCIPLFYSFIWYEHFGSDQRRTLINRLFAFLWKIFIFYHIVIRVCEMAYSNVGHFPQWFCLIYSLLKGACASAVLLTIDAVTMTRHIFIFRLKNPGRVEDEFWSTFLSMWILGVSLIMHFVWFSLPGVQPIYFYICKGDFTAAEQELPSKSRLFLVVLVIISVVINAVVLCKIKIYKWKEKRNKIVTTINSQILDKSFLSDLLLCCFILCTVTTVLYSTYMSQIYLQSNTEENSSYNVFWWEHVLAPLGHSVIGVVVLVKRRGMPTLFVAELTLIWNRNNNNT